MTQNDITVFDASMKWVMETPRPNEDNTQDEWDDFEMFYDIFTKQIWDRSENIMRFGNDDQKNMMINYAADCDKEWDGQSWVDL